MCESFLSLSVKESNKCIACVEKCKCTCEIFSFNLPCSTAMKYYNQRCNQSMINKSGKYSQSKFIPPYKKLPQLVHQTSLQENLSLRVGLYHILQITVNKILTINYEAKSTYNQSTTLQQLVVHDQSTLLGNLKMREEQHYQ